MKTKTIRVTAEDIRLGDASNIWSCPIALAATRAFGARGVSVYPQYLAMGAIGDRQTLELPRKAKKFIAAFDSLHSVEPFAFRVNL